jgi:hypothetical protein
VNDRQPAEVRSFAFGEPDTDLAGAVSVWDGGFCSTLGPAAEVEGYDPDDEWQLAGAGFELTFAPASEVAELELAEAGIRSSHQLARVHGTVVVDGREQVVDCAGQRSRRVGTLDGKHFNAVRAVSAWFGSDSGLAVLSARPRRARGHDADVLSAVLFEGDLPPIRVSEPRLSSTYSADGALVRVGLELWFGEEDEQYARRAAGSAAGRVAVCEDPPLRSELVRWLMRGREGLGVYDLLRAR